MSILSMEFWTAIHPAVVLTAAFPLILTLIIWSVYNNQHAAKLGILTRSLNKVIQAGADMPERSLSNLEGLEAFIHEKATPDFASAWSRMKSQIDNQYTESLIPEARAFFGTEMLITIPAGRNLIGGLNVTILTLAILSVLLPLGASLAVDGSLTIGAVLCGICTGVFLGIVHIIYTSLDQSAYDSALLALNRFYDTFDRVLPVAGTLAGPALLLKSTLESRKSFEEATSRMTDKISESTDRITEKFVEFTEGGVLPALIDAVQAITDRHILPALNDFKSLSNQTMAKVIERQESGMSELTTSFAERLSDTIELRMKVLAESLGNLTTQMTTMAHQSDEQMKSFGTQYHELMKGQQESLTQSADILIKAAQLQTQAAESNSQLNTNVDLMSGTMSKFQIQTDHFITEVMDFSVKNSAAQLKMSEDINAAQLKLEDSLESSMEKYAQMSALISGMMTDITERMNEAMAGAGREIALGINQVTAENAEAIAQLTIQAQNLRDDYTSYFDRTEDSTKAMLENLDYQMHGLMTTMTDGIGALLKDTVQENATVLSQYKDQTVGLLQSFEEQALSISLYAKEINMDITELTGGIRTAISDFTTNIQEGVKLTIGEFDQGLAELTTRIANTVESINDAVENIPKALSRK